MYHVLSSKLSTYTIHVFTFRLQKSQVVTTCTSVIIRHFLALLSYYECSFNLLLFKIQVHGLFLAFIKFVIVITLKSCLTLIASETDVCGLWYCGKFPSISHAKKSECTLSTLNVLK